MRFEEFSLPLKAPLSTAAGEIRNRTGFVIQMGGGLGEAAPLSDWTESHGECKRALAGVEEPDCSLRSLDDAPAARHGLALAIADGDAFERGEPLYRHLGGDSADRIPVNATLGDGSPETTAEAAREAVAAGVGTLKCKVGVRSVEEDLERIRAIREAVGSEPAIRLDANGAWNRERAERAIEALSAFDIEYIEQPLPADDIAGHRALSAPVPIALDESLAGRTIPEIEAIADAADAFVLKPMALGGVDRVVDLGRKLDDVVVTTTIDAVIARTAAVHAAAALGIERACGLATADLLAADLGPDPAPISGGSISVPQEPGLGIGELWNEGECDA